MSGIEIAGLVLGAFPLLIFALESYRESSETIRDWYKIQRPYRYSVRTLGIQKVHFERNVERFLLPLVVDDAELKILMEDPAGKGWEDPDLEARLRTRLPGSYRLFLDTIVEINEIMESMKKELGVTNPSFHARVIKDGVLIKNGSRADLISRANFEFQTKRIKFSLKKSTRERLLKQLEHACNQMQKLLELDEQIVKARQQRNTSKSTHLLDRKMNDFWRYAQRLHEALTKAWQCSCTSHIANLGLASIASDNIEFDILFCLKAAAHRSTKIKMIANNSNVKITVPQPSTLAKVRLSTATDQIVRTAEDSMCLIHDLRSALDTTCADCIGFLEDDDHRFVLYHDASALEGIGMPTTTTLQELLEGGDILTRRKRYCLALVLANSFQRLGATPWVNTQLRKENIVFFSSLGDLQTAVLEQPYITQEMMPSLVAQPTDALASLGIRLLELCFGRPLETTQFRKAMGTGDAVSAPILDWAAAMQWSKLVGGEAGEEFAGAVEWCLRANELTDANWRRDFAQNVVAPLESCHRQMSQKPWNQN